MIKFLTGNEREIEDMINDALENLPGAETAGIITPYATPRGIMFCILIEYGAKPDEVETDGKDTGDSDKRPDGEGEKTTES